jgi:chromatin remodeling complex protein RSC6
MYIFISILSIKIEKNNLKVVSYIIKIKTNMPSERRSKRPTKTSRKSRATAAVAEENHVPDVADVVEEPRSSVASAALEVSVPVTAEIQAILNSVETEASELETRFAELFAILDTELAASREDKNRNVNLRTWKALIKSVQKARNAALRASRKKKRNTTTKSENYGFNKPIKVSKDLAKFAGWNADELHSRIEVTRLVCQYVKDNNLQNPENRKQIIPDRKLTKLLSYDAAKDEPLTFTSFQKFIRPHYLKEE